MGQMERKGRKRRQGTDVIGSEGREQDCGTEVSHPRHQLETRPQHFRLNMCCL